METSTSTIRAAASADAASAESCMNELMLVTGSRPANWCAPRRPMDGFHLEAAAAPDTLSRGVIASSDTKRVYF